MPRALVGDLVALHDRKEEGQELGTATLHEVHLEGARRHQPTPRNGSHVAFEEVGAEPRLLEALLADPLEWNVDTTEGRCRVVGHEADAHCCEEELSRSLQLRRKRTSELKIDTSTLHGKERNDKRKAMKC